MRARIGNHIIKAIIKITTSKNGQLDQPNYLELVFVALKQYVRKQIQQKLASKGFYHCTIDGLWGRKTSKAVRLFAQKHGLESESSTPKHVAAIYMKMTI